MVITIIITVATEIIIMVTTEIEILPIMPVDVDQSQIRLQIIEPIEPQPL